MEEEKKSSKKREVDRYHYIGFDVFPGKVKEFWKSEEEKKVYLEKAKKGTKREERDHSLVYVDIFTGLEKTILTISSLIIVICFFLPWFVLEKGSISFKYSALDYIFNFGFLTSYSGMGGFVASLFVALLFMTLILSFLCGIGTLYFLHRKANPIEKYYSSLKRMLLFNYFPIFLWLVAAIISIVGFPSPFGSSFGVKEISENFNFISFVTATGFGMWVTLACLLLNVWKIADL